MSEPSGNIDILILAAGKGTRLPSKKPKTLQRLLGETMLRLNIHAVSAVPKIRQITVVIGHEADQVQNELANISANYSDLKIVSVLQPALLGTGDALREALPSLPNEGQVLVLNADMPLIRPELLQAFIHRAAGQDIAVLSMTLENPAAYGRIQRTNEKFVAIVEAKDFDPSRHGALPNEVNSGIFLLNIQVIRSTIPHLQNNNRSGEYYITDLAELAIAHGYTAEAVKLESLGDFQPACLLGVNTPADLAIAEKTLQVRQTEQLLANGVILHAPESIYVSPLCRVEPGVEIYGPCEISGASSLAAGAVVLSHCWIHNSSLGQNCLIKPFCHLENAVVGPHCVVGPYARLRPESVLEEDAHIGNFVEIKKSRIRTGAKANHLTYIGDAVIGPHVNIGAGTITCNYDGKNKFPTIIEEGAFIGSNTALVAPVTVGANSIIGAGSVITKDVPAECLAIARGKQKNLNRK